MAQFPRRGRVVSELSDPLIREVICSPYRIVYRIDEQNQIIYIFESGIRPEAIHRCEGRGHVLSSCPFPRRFVFATNHPLRRAPVSSSSRS
ncbi:MAG: type II toxin-antitoxin system RelE/ParE family toxin [Verrucomicrobia bacterium]|nr:type II toxin-antitoxin system RelE/ParE family toxin [Verrucomicrobiota bacterium]